MIDSSVAFYGGLCAVITGLLYVLNGIIYFTDPARNSTNAHMFMSIISENVKPRMRLFWSMGFTAVFALGAVPSISALVQQHNAGLVQWVTLLAIVGFGTMAVENFRAIQIIPVLLYDYQKADDAIKVPIARSSSLVVLDARGFLVFGGVGMFLLVSNLLAIRFGLWPVGLAVVGIINAVMYVSMVVGGLMRRYSVFKIIAGAGGLVAAPVWFIWMGFVLLHYV